MVSNNAHIGLSPGAGTPLQFGQKLPVCGLSAGAGTRALTPARPEPSVYPAGAGTPPRICDFLDHRRFIPLARGTLFSRTVKPLFFGLSRWRGNTYIEALRKSAALVYPLARGTLFFACLVGWSSRFIPLAREH
ncbi:hypothetical protein JRY29_07655 [Salmonella enterica subsp. enterica serovar Kentucky]|nr:hypothetical protein JRY29_07655 [Salmonella enterica subsp. enterica serovar Kentucky]